MSGNLRAEERCVLADRVARWCYDETESWGDGRFGEGMAYLLWAIVANDGHPFESTLCPEDYAELVLVLTGPASASMSGTSYPIDGAWTAY